MLTYTLSLKEGENMLNNINVDGIKRNGKVSRQSVNGDRPIALTFATIALFSTLTGCSKNKVEVPAETTQTSTVEAVESSSASAETTQTEEAEAVNGFVIGVNDTYLQADWDSFVDGALTEVDGKLNNNSDGRFRMALSVLNVEYLSKHGEKILADQFGLGTDVESILNAYYGFASQIREFNTEIENTDDYISFSAFLLDEQDRAIIERLEEYAKEMVILSNDLTDENKARIQEIFDTVLAFINGTGTIDVTINGKVQTFAEADLSRGGIFAAENIAQTISVMSKDVVAQENREILDGQLRTQDALAKVQELIIKYQTLGSMRGIDTEKQTEIFDLYTKSYAIVLAELKAIGCTEEEAKAVYTLANIDYFVDSLESHNVFELIYPDGIDINAMFENAERAMEKIVIYNDSQTSIDNIYDMSRLVMVNESDAISLMALSQTAYNVTSKDANVSIGAVNIIKGYSQYSSDVTVDYQTTDSNGNVINHSLDKNALSKGATQIANLYTYYSVINHKDIYGGNADAILPLVDGSQTGLSPYESIVLMVEGHCVDRHIVVYYYEMGANTQGQK